MADIFLTLFARGGGACASVRQDPGGARLRGLLGSRTPAGSTWGRVIVAGDVVTSVGRDSGAGYVAEGQAEGVFGSFEFYEIGVVIYADGHRYEGNYSMRGADAVLLRERVGATYDTQGNLLEAGRYENDGSVSSVSDRVQTCF